MNKTLSKLILVGSLMLGYGSSYAESFGEGLDAAISGNYSQALSIWRPLAQQGNMDAQMGLGNLYFNGDGVSKNYKEAAKWWRKSAEQGHSGAQFNLATLYDRGEGVLQDYKEAVKWYRLSAANGFTSAQFNLGGMYDKGLGVPSSKVFAHMWWNIAASDGDEDAAKNRASIERSMSSEEITKAQKLARECVKNNYKDC